MKKILLATVAFLTFGIAGCETHHDHDRDHAQWDHRNHDYYQWRNSGGYPEHERGYQPPTPVYREYPDYRH